MQGWGWKQVHHPDHVDRVVARWKQAHDTGEPWEDTFPLRSKDGQYRWFLSRAMPIHDANGKIVQWFGTNTDVTDQRVAEESLRRLKDDLEVRVKQRTQDLRQSQVRLRALTSELNLAEQRERKRLATELHDYLQQLLVYGKLTIGLGKRRVADVSAVVDVMKKVDEVLSEALTYTRTLVAELSPPVLRDHGLAAGLKWLAEYMRKHEQTVTVTVPEGEGPELPDDQVMLLFQSVRELLINALKHAETSSTRTSPSR
jgi:signal transduction histidine kinase